TIRGLAAGHATIAATSEGKAGTAEVSVSPPTPAQLPGTVGDLAVTGSTDSSATVAFTEVTNGLNQPASYDIRYARPPVQWGTATSVKRGSCAVPLGGTTIGARKTCTILGLNANTA